MAYFPHAFQKMLVATNGTTPFYSVAGSATTVLQAGSVAVVNAATNLTLDLTVAPSYLTTPMVYLAQGSFYANDLVGPFAGGYQETVKSKGINPKYVSEFYVTEPAPALNNVLQICQENCTIDCDKMYDLRIDIKGSPALRFLTHNIYQTLSAYSGCCDDPSTPSPIDPNLILLQWADQINGTGNNYQTVAVGGNSSVPFLNNFIQAVVWNLDQTLNVTGVEDDDFITVVSSAGISVGDKLVIPALGITAYVGSTFTPGDTDIPLVTPAGTPITLPADILAGPGDEVKFYVQIDSATYVPVTGAPAATQDSCMDIIGAYVDTVFGNCSFSPMDHFEREPIMIYASAVSYSNNSNDINGDPCAVSCFDISELQPAVQGKGYGETLVRELILVKRYRQEPWYQDPRMREVMGDTVLGDGNGGNPELVRGNSYYVYHILHSVPRKSNPTGTMDNDQYLIKVVANGRDADFEAFFNALLVSANNAVSLQVLA
jgi:hypothetical protein